MLTSSSDQCLAEIEEAFRRAVGWIDANLMLFDFRVESDPARQLVMLKPFSELVLCVDVVSSCGVAWPQATAHAEWAWSRLSEGELIFRLLAARPDLCQLASLVASMDSLGYRNERLLQLIRGLNRMRSVRAMEFEPWVRWSVIHALERLGIPKAGDPPWERTWIAQMPEPWTLASQSAYAVTHEVFYATDFGRRGFDVSSGREIVAYLELWLPAWIDHYSSVCNWDLVGEFSMVIDALGLGVVPHPANRLIAEQQADGHLPGPAGAGAELARASDSVERREFLRTYHTTLVFAMALGIHFSRLRT